MSAEIYLIVHIRSVTSMTR